MMSRDELLKSCVMHAVALMSKKENQYAAPMDMLMDFGITFIMTAIKSDMNPSDEYMDIIASRLTDYFQEILDDTAKMALNSAFGKKKPVTFKDPREDNE
jgi:hypothetical protein